MTCVSWHDARAYAKWLSEKTGKAYRLPSESEWEYVSRSGTDTRYWWGEEIVEGKANCDGCGSEWDNKSTSPVGRFSANGFGLYDTLGNVWEWVEDCWHGNYEGAPVDGSAWLASNDGNCDQRVLRGGSWVNLPYFLRSADRGRSFSSEGDGDTGFRLARTL